MKTYAGENVRNVAVIGHSHSGKTSLVSALLFTAGTTPRLGRVDDGSTITDYDEEEVARQMTISASLAAIGARSSISASSRKTRCTRWCPRARICTR